MQPTLQWVSRVVPDALPTGHATGRSGHISLRGWAVLCASVHNTIGKKFLRGHQVTDAGGSRLMLALAESGAGYAGEFHVALKIA